MTKKTGGRLENWNTTHAGYVIGIIYDDPRGDGGEGYDFRDGNFVATSQIVKLDEQNGILETKNTIYTLGKRMELP